MRKCCPKHAERDCQNNVLLVLAGKVYSKGPSNGSSKPSMPHDNLMTPGEAILRPPTVKACRKHRNCDPTAPNGEAHGNGSKEDVPRLACDIYCERFP